MSDPSFDFVIVGGGVGGLTAAITAKLAGLRPLLLEKTPLIGGSSVLSGGVLWLPNNPLMAREGVADSREDGLRYLANFVREDDVASTPARREVFVDTVQPLVEMLEAQGMKFLRCPGYSDYYDQLPGGCAAGRSIEAKFFDANRLGAWKARFRAPSISLPVYTGEGARLMRVGVTLDGKTMAAKVAGRLVWSKLTGRTLYGNGGALQGRLLEIALRLGVDIWTDAPLVDLDMSNGRVEGVHISHEGKPVTVRAKRGVLVAAGGFARNRSMRERYQRHPITDEWTRANPGDTGEAIEAMARAGAKLSLMDESWWVMSFIVPGEEPVQIVPELVKPHGLLVDKSGKRFVNEAAPYMEVGRACYARNTTVPAIPAWLAMDARARRRYFFGFHPPGAMPRDLLAKGWIKRDGTLAGLARQCGIDPAGLEAQVARFNGFCETGVDEDFGRGSNAYQRFYSDPTVKPNPTLGTIAEPPFWAVPLVPGDVGTCGGAVANENAEVLRADGSAIPGLYAAGNCTAPLAGPHYIGAGLSIAASSLFGYIAANRAAR
jgi:3-oxosteroid 1-dehydrogenase